MAIVKRGDCSGSSAGDCCDRVNVDLARGLGGNVVEFRRRGASPRQRDRFVAQAIDATSLRVIERRDVRGRARSRQHRRRGDRACRVTIQGVHIRSRHARVIGHRDTFIAKARHGSGNICRISSIDVGEGARDRRRSSGIHDAGRLTIHGIQRRGREQDIIKRHRLRAKTRDLTGTHGEYGINFTCKAGNGRDGGRIDGPSRPSIDSDQVCGVNHDIAQRHILVSEVRYISAEAGLIAECGCDIRRQACHGGNSVGVNRPRGLPREGRHGRRRNGRVGKRDVLIAQARYLQRASRQSRADIRGRTRESPHRISVDNARGVSIQRIQNTGGKRRVIQRDSFIAQANEIARGVDSIRIRRSSTQGRHARRRNGKRGHRGNRSQVSRINGRCVYGNREDVIVAVVRQGLESGRIRFRHSRRDDTRTSGV